MASLIRKLTEQVEQMQTEIRELKGNQTISVVEQPEASVLDPVKDELAEMRAKIIDLEESIEERTNRQLRQTLVFRNIPENVSEKRWADTKGVISEKIANLLAISEDEAWDMVNRCHRSGDKSYYEKKKKHRPIFVNMFSWDVCENITKNARKERSFFVDYKYGPRTTKRRNLALAKPKELKATGAVDQAYIQYPAILMGKKSNEKNYRVIENFSSKPVEIRRRDIK